MSVCDYTGFRINRIDTVSFKKNNKKLWVYLGKVPITDHRSAKTPDKAYLREMTTQNNTLSKSE